MKAVQYAINFLRILRISDVADILIVWICLYYFMMAIKGTRAVQLVRGIIVAAFIYMFSGILRLHTLNFILSAIVQVAMFGVIVIFQPELRKLLEHMGRLKIFTYLGLVYDTSAEENMIENISVAVSNMSATKTGALIVIERQTRLGEYMNSGTTLNADVSSQLLENIFVPNTPLHDGAVIIRDDKITNAGCVLPLTANPNLSSEFGTRHRAALGLSELSDAIVIIVSEETGKISIALNGSMTRNLSKNSLSKALTKLLNTESPQTERNFMGLRFGKSK